MKLFKTIFLIFSICLFALSASSFASVVSARQAHPDTRSVSDSSGDERSYIVRRMGDDVAVFEGAEEEPIGILDVRFSELPEEDRELLECGIMVCGDGQLISLIEDYTG